MRAENQPIETPLLGGAGSGQSAGIRRCLAILLAVLCGSCAALLLAPLSPSARAAGCPNEAIRGEQGAAALALPDCRAYELVSPGSTPYMSTSGGVGQARASTTGSGIAYFTRYPSAAAERSGFRYLATRGPSGWSVADVLPQGSPASSLLFDCSQGIDFSPDLSRSILSDGWDPPGGADSGYCGESEQVLAPGAPRGYGNLYLQEGLGGPYQAINLTPAGVVPANAVLRAYTPSFAHILFEEEAPLVPGAPAGELLLYEWTAGTLHLVSVLPNGEPVSGKLADGDRGDSYLNLAPITHAVSDDGETVFFSANGNLYVRRNATQPQTASGACSPAEPGRACTAQVDLNRGGTGPSGGGVFWAAAADGSRAYFAADRPLTADSQAVTGKPDLYEYTVANGLLKDRSLAEGSRPNVSGLSGVSADGSRFYFVARGVLTGSGENGHGDVAQPFSPNLYLLDRDGVSFVATLAEEDRYDWNDGLGNIFTAVSPDGRYIAFGSMRELTGIPSTPVEPSACEAATCQEIFLYDAQDEQIECVSCGTAPPLGDTRPQSPYSFTGKAGHAVAYSPRQVFDDGRVLFTTANALVPRDENGTADVYEYLGGQPWLISSGRAIGDSAFYDADPTGANVFFVTSQGLVRSDTDNGLSIYDARVGGGFAEPPAAPSCEGESCRGPTPAAPTGSTPASVGFVGPAEGAKHPRRQRCKRGFVKRRGSCRKKRRHRAAKKRAKHGKHRKHRSSKGRH